MAKRSAPSVAYFEEEDDEGNLIGEPQYARSTAHSSPSKEKPNTSRSRKDSNRRNSKDYNYKDYKDFKEPKSPIVSSLSDSDDSAELARRLSKLKMKGDKKRREDPLVSQQRPVPRTRKTAPPPASRLSEESSYYGIHPQQPVSSIPARPRARASTRPESYYGQRPPLSTSAYTHQPPLPTQLPPPSFPPPQPYWMGGPPPPPSMGHALVHQPIPSPSAYGEPFPPNRDLASRFGRPQSAMGFQPPPKALDYEPVKEKALTRRASAARKASKDHDDRHRMPPPPRPASTQPNRLVIRPTPSHTAPPSQTASRRKSVGFTEGELRAADPSLYKAVARREVEYGTGALPPRPRQSYDTESIYDVGNYEIEPASRGRRGSFYNFEEKVRDASRYQEDVSGGNGPPLTAEALRRVKNGGSSRSTRSSASRDESDYKQSATTRTTRSGSGGDDDITIKLPMGAVIEVGNTKIHCKDGGNMNIGRGNGTSRAGGSDHAAPSNYSDERSERKSRADRSERRTRTGSYSRTRSTGPPLYPRSPSDYPHYDDYDDHYDPPPPHAPYMGYYDEVEDDESYFDC